MRYLSTTMSILEMILRLTRKSIPLAGSLLLLSAPAAHAAIVAEGTYTISAPEHRAIPFRMAASRLFTSA